MKKILAIALAMIMMFSLVACTGNSGGNQGGAGPDDDVVDADFTMK